MAALLSMGGIIPMPSSEPRRRVYRSPEERRDLNAVKAEKKRKRKISQKSRKANRRKAA